MRDLSTREAELDTKIGKLSEVAAKAKADTFEPIPYPADSPQYRATYYYRRRRYLLAKAALKYQIKNKKRLMESHTARAVREAQRTAKKQVKSLERTEYLKLSPLRAMLGAARGRARKLNLPFNIELEDLAIPENCPILGIPLVRSTGQGPTKNSPSLDRIIPQNGYIKGNVQVISRQANIMKRDATLEQLVAFATWVNKLSR